MIILPEAGGRLANPKSEGRNLHPENSYMAAVAGGRKSPWNARSCGVPWLGFVEKKMIEYRSPRNRRTQWMYRPSTLAMLFFVLTT